DIDMERMVIVRYRSRRDIADLYADPAFAAASVHKWAALRSNVRMLAEGRQVPEGVLPALLVALLAGYGVSRGLSRRWSRRG
ncbi:hypothetical protein, partial [Sphingopyxis sp.]|uniref:hypothetical protein n=1 Tax=Sphingopyxis sp. TaxID=1908224 RepID=UPI002B4A6A06